eukprot:GAHX01001659.1.p1 GENE.GAHX01001659.1~~GAHX01001659.1.p1  ORF type:complete len:700 (-),score=147.71 GAHX01001659.1:1407-3317(-)
MIILVSKEPVKSKQGTNKNHEQMINNVLLLIFKLFDQFVAEFLKTLYQNSSQSNTTQQTEESAQYFNIEHLNNLKDYKNERPGDHNIDYSNIYKLPSQSKTNESVSQLKRLSPINTTGDANIIIGEHNQNWSLIKNDTYTYCSDYKDGSRLVECLQQLEAREAKEQMEIEKCNQFYNEQNLKIELLGFGKGVEFLGDLLKNKNAKVINGDRVIIPCKHLNIETELNNNTNVSEGYASIYKIVLNELAETIKENTQQLKFVDIMANPMFIFEGSSYTPQSHLLTENKPPKKHVRGKKKKNKKELKSQAPEIININYNKENINVENPLTQQSIVDKIIETIELENKGIQIRFNDCSKYCDLELNVSNVKLDNIDLIDFQGNSYGLFKLEYKDVRMILEHNLLYIRAIIFCVKSHSMFNIINASSEQIKKLLNNFVSLRAEFKKLIIQIKNTQKCNKEDKEEISPEQSIFISSVILQSILTSPMNIKELRNKQHHLSNETKLEMRKLQSFEEGLRDMFLKHKAYIYNGDISGEIVKYDLDTTTELNYDTGEMKEYEVAHTEGKAKLYKSDVDELLEMHLNFELKNYKRVFKYLTDQLYEDDKLKETFYKVNVLLLVFRREGTLFNQILTDSNNIENMFK